MSLEEWSIYVPEGVPVKAPAEDIKCMDLGNISSEYDFKITPDEMEMISLKAIVEGERVESAIKEFLDTKYKDRFNEMTTSQADLIKKTLAKDGVKAWCAANGLPHPPSPSKLYDQVKEIYRQSANELTSHDEERIVQAFEFTAAESYQAEKEAAKTRKPKDTNVKIGVSKSKKETKPSVEVKKGNNTTKTSNPSPSFLRSTMEFIGNAQIAESEAKLAASKALTSSVSNFFQKAMSKVKDVAAATAKAADAAYEKATDYIAEKMVEVERVLPYLPESIKEVHDEMTDKLSDVMLNSYNKCTTALRDWLYGEPYEMEDYLRDLGYDFDKIKHDFANDAKFHLEDVWMNADFGDDVNMDQWYDYWDTFEETLSLEELWDLYDQAMEDGNDEMVNYYSSLMDSYEQEWIDGNNGLSGHYAEQTLSIDTNKLNIKKEVSSDMDNLILQAISKYLPAKYRNVNYLPSIPHDILEEACSQMELELKQSDESALSASDKERILNIMWMSSGLGGYHNQLQTFMTALNRFGGNTVTPSTEHVGLTFITRPRLCLQSSNLRNNRVLTSLDTLNNSTMAFAIRCLLDSNFGNANDGLYSWQVNTSPIFDSQNPFLVPLCNALTSFNGSPDIDLESITTDGGYMSEAQSFAIGGSNLQRGNYNLTLNFQEVAHNPILAILYYWIEYIRCVTRGSLMAYADDIDAQRLNYTVSIYRFLLDPSHRYITKYAKYTGCYPTGLPIGSSFNFNQGDVEVNASKQLSITFTCNKVEYMDYAILMDFNTLMRRYCPVINKAVRTEIKTRDITRTVYTPVYRGAQYNPVTGRFDRGGSIEYVPRTEVIGQEQYAVETDVDYAATDDSGNPNTRDVLKCPVLPIEALSNFRGLPYIVSDRNGFRLEFRQHSSPAYPTQTSLADQLLYLDMIHRLSKEMANYESISSFYTPDYANKAKSYKNVDLRDFIRKAFNQSASSILNNGIQTGII